MHVAVIRYFSELMFRFGTTYGTDRQTDRQTEKIALTRQVWGSLTLAPIIYIV